MLLGQLIQIILNEMFFFYFMLMAGTNFNVFYKLNPITGHFPISPLI